MKIRTLAVVATALFLPFAAAACGADSTGELDKGDLTKELQDAGYTEAQAECAADKVIAADFSKEEIDKANEELAAGNITSTDERAQELIEAFTSCLTGS